MVSGYENFEHKAGEQEKRLTVEKIVKLHECLRGDFEEHFLSKNYSQTEPLSISDTENDTTVAFIGSSVNSYKSLIEQRTDSVYPQFVIQPCLRTQDFKNAYNIHDEPFGQPFFHIFGTYSGPGTYIQTCDDALSFLINRRHISPTNLKACSTENARGEELVSPFASDIATESTTELEYVWKYGINDTYGIGVNFHLYSQSTESWRDVGSVVSIRDAENNEIGTEFGFGLEFFLAAENGLDDPFETTVMRPLVEIRDGLHKKLYVYLQANLEMLAACSIHGPSRQSRIFRRYINNLNFLRKACGENIGHIENIGRQYYQATNRDQDKIVDLVTRLQNRELIVNSLHSIIRNKLYNKSLYDDDRFLTNMLTYCQQNGIRNEELQQFVASNYADRNELDILFTHERS